VTTGAPDYGYPWWLNYGHLVVAAPAALIWLMAIRRQWPRALVVLVAAVTLWSVTAFLVARFALNVNGPMTLPTQHFVESGAGRVLDIGAGTGRSTVMVLEARPRVTAVALDLFGESFDEHFGDKGSGVERLRANLRAAGVDTRATIEPGDMRHLPFEAGVFDAVLSTYAMDHLRRDDSRVAVEEAARVLKPGGDFLLMVIEKDGWLQFTFGPLLLHSGTRGADWWQQTLRGAGLVVAETGTRPATLYVLARKPR
jgi:SAM-dependent methyltransferase